MFKALICAMAALALSACSLLPTDKKLAEIAAQHRADVCARTEAVTKAANLTITLAAKVEDADLRAAMIAGANAELAIVATCPVSGTT